MSDARRSMLVVVGALVSVPAVFFAASSYLGRMVQAEYQSGARVSTDVDSIVIPAFGLTVLWIGLLLIVSAVRGFMRGRRALRGL